MQLIAAMAAEPEVYHEAVGLGADQLIQGAQAKWCLKQFDPVSGAFDVGAFEANREAFALFNEADQQVYGHIGSFRLKRLIDRLRKHYQQQRILQTAQSNYEQADDQLNAMSGLILELGSIGQQDDRDAEEIEAALDDLDRAHQGKPSRHKIPWPTDWLRRFGPIGKHELVIVGGRPGSGKSALMAQIAHDFASSGHTVMFITLEMSKNELRHRLAALRAGFSEKRVDGLSEAKYRTYRKHFEAIAGMDNLILAEKYSISAIVSAISRQAIRKLDAVFIDYLQLVLGPGERRLDQLTHITRTLKLTAKDLRVPIFCGSQLNRLSDTQDRAPKLSDLRESGSIEQDADRVLLLWDRADKPFHQIGQAKCRNGERQLINATFTGETTSFAPYKEPSAL